MTDRQTEIEIKLAHLEDAMNKMSDVVYSQQAALDSLERAYALLQQRMVSMENPAENSGGAEKPPHY